MKTAVFSFGRFNPPTVGHEKLIKKVESIAEQNKADFYIYPSWSQSPDKDPLPHESKYKYMKKAFPKYADKIISNKKCKTAIHVLTKLYDAGYESVMMVVGSDRISEFDRLLNKYNGKEAVHGFYKFKDVVDKIRKQGGSPSETTSKKVYTKAIKEVRNILGPINFDEVLTNKKTEKKFRQALVKAFFKTEFAKKVNKIIREV